MYDRDDDANGNDCPCCERNIGMGAVFRASLPNRIYCPHCRARLEYGETGALIAFAIAAVIVIVAGAVLAYVVAGGNREGVSSFLIAFGVLALGAAVLEVGLVIQLWYGKYRLQEVGKPRRTDDEDRTW